MPRANRYYLPNRVWHLTHRCHKREFLLKFGRDRSRWTSWLFQARKRHGLSVLNYVVTSNHIHLLVFAGEDRLAIPRSMQLLAGRTAQEFNNRKKRKGAYWEDRYHATAVETGDHLRRCMTYIDMNMIRAGVVDHPLDWPWGGYREIQSPPRRYARIDRTLLCRLLNLPDLDTLAAWQMESVSRALRGDATAFRGRCPEWTESVAVGSQAYAMEVRTQLGLTGRHREVDATGADGMFSLHEEDAPYGCNSDPENGVVSAENALFWRLTV